MDILKSSGISDSIYDVASQRYAWDVKAYIQQDNVFLVGQFFFLTTIVITCEAMDNEGHTFASVTPFFRRVLLWLVPKNDLQFE
jgi:hypothetical protein